MIDPTHTLIALGDGRGCSSCQSCECHAPDALAQPCVNLDDRLDALRAKVTSRLAALDAEGDLVETIVELIEEGRR